jgi:hypothetical protein
VARFAVGPDPFAAGQRRGIDLAAAPGRPALAPCRGRVAFAGAVPRRGGAVSIRCGRLTATVLGLDARALAVATGAPVARRLGARRTAERFGYVDPERLLAPAPAGVPAVGPARRVGPRGDGRPRARPAPRTAPLSAPDRRPRAALAARPADVPLVAWIGLALLAVAAPSGGLLARRARATRARTRPFGAPGSRWRAAGR